MLPVQIAVHHLNDGSVAVDVCDDDRDFGQPREQSGFCTAMPGDNLVIIRSFQAADNDRGENAVLTDALRQRRKRVILPYLIGMPFEGLQPGDRQSSDRDRRGIDTRRSFR